MELDDEALADLDRAIALNPKDASALASRGGSYWVIARYDQALADLNRAIELVPEDASAFVDRGETYQAMERYEEALADFDRAIELSAADALAVTARGATYQEMGRYDQAWPTLTVPPNSAAPTRPGPSSVAGRPTGGWGFMTKLWPTSIALLNSTQLRMNSPLHGLRSVN